MDWVQSHWLNLNQSIYLTFPYYIWLSHTLHLWNISLNFFIIRQVWTYHFKSVFWWHKKSFCGNSLVIMSEILLNALIGNMETILYMMYDMKWWYTILLLFICSQIFSVCDNSKALELSSNALQYNFREYKIVLTPLLLLSCRINITVIQSWNDCDNAMYSY